MLEYVRSRSENVSTFLQKFWFAFLQKKPSLAVWAVAPLDVGEQYIKAAFTMQFLEVQRDRSQGQTWLDAFFVQNHWKFYKKFIEIGKFNWNYRHVRKILECYVYRLHSPCNFWKFNSSGLKVRPDWMPFFVQNHCKFYNKFIEIREFNWKYRHIGKNVEDYIHIGCFHHAIFGSSTCRLKVRSDWMSFFCKITAKFIKCSIANRCLFTFIQYL